MPIFVGNASPYELDTINYMAERITYTRMKLGHEYPATNPPTIFVYIGREQYRAIMQVDSLSKYSPHNFPQRDYIEWLGARLYQVNVSNLFNIHIGEIT